MYTFFVCLFMGMTGLDEEDYSPFTGKGPPIPALGSPKRVALKTTNRANISMLNPPAPAETHLYKSLYLVKSVISKIEIIVKLPGFIWRKAVGAKAVKWAGLYLDQNPKMSAQKEMSHSDDNFMGV